MSLRWTSKASSDLARLYEFLAPVNNRVAIKVVKSLVMAAEQLLENPRIGVRLEQFEPLEVRRIFVGNYEIRYEFKENVIYIVRLWHTKENRY